MNAIDIPRNYPEWQDAAIHLLKGPVFEHEGERWRQVTQGRGEIDGYVRQVGLRVVIDAIDGYAYVEQLPAEEMGDRPRLMRRRTLSLPVTVYGIFLRQELDRAIKDDPAVFRVRRTYRQIRELVAEFFPATNNESADRRQAMGFLNELCEMGFLRKVTVTGGPDEEFELTRFLRAKFNPTATQELTDRIRKHLKLAPHDPESPNDTGTDAGDDARSDR